jgi:fibronectin-binding autotransporter adhesin
MNIIYRLVWSHSHNDFVVASETTKSRKKTKGRSVSLISLLSALILPCAPAIAVDINWASAYPSYLFPTGTNYDQVLNTGFAFTIDGATATPNHYAAGTVLNILGPLPTITAGINGSATPLLVRNGLADSTGPAADPGRITFIEATDSGGGTTTITSANIDEFSYSTNPATPQQNQELNVVVPGLEGSNSVIKVYDSTTFSAPGTSLVGDLPLNVYDPDSFRIYNNFGIASVTSVGGTANVNIGADTNGSTAISAPANSIELLAKNSTLAQAQAAGAATSAVNWLSDNAVHFAPAAVISNDLQDQQAVSSQYNDSITLPNYVQVGPLVALDPLEPSITFTIHSAQDIAKVNDFLLGQGAYSGRNSQVQLWLTGGVTLPAEFGGAVIDSTNIAQNTYNGIIQGLLAEEEQNRINLTYHVWDDKLAHTNNATLGTGNLNVIYATGANASGTVTNTGSLAVNGATAVMRADTGALLTNNGSINAWRSSSASPQAIGMQATDARAVNNGTLNAGLFLEKNGSNQNVSNQGSIGMQGNGASTLTNNGYINTALTDGTSSAATGLQANGTTAATNNGSIAVVGNSRNADGRAAGFGADISGSATFTNGATGSIYIGTTPITSAAAASPVVMVGGAEPSAGIRTSSGGAVNNLGTITLGASTRNAVGMLVKGATGPVTNNGTINVLGNLAGGSAAPNYGLSVTDTNTVTNNGKINVTGDNNVAINVLAQTVNTTVNSTDLGTIVVGSAGDTGGSDDDPLTYRNYAVYAEGLSGHQATANIDTTMRLLAAGAIGAHARGSATINVGPLAALTFNNTNQIGYYAYGEAAKINLSTAVINDNGQADSTLFVVGHGAVFDGSSGTSAGAYQLTVNGSGSIGVFANGVDEGPDGIKGNADDTASSLNTGAATITVGGENGIGVKVAGGAVGTINNGGIILSHNDTTAVVVDGRSYAIDNTPGNANNALVTSVVSNAQTTTSASQSGIKGYDVSYLGKVTLGGSGISLSGNSNIGLYLHNNGTGINNAPISVAGTNNIGVYIQDQGTLTNAGDISVSGATGSGNVGVKVQGSGAQVTQLGNVTASGGLAAVQLINNGATLAISGTDNHITASAGADGIRMDAGATSLTAANTTIDISGTGAGINNNADTSNINLNGVTINAGDGPAIRTAVTFKADGSGNILNVNGAGSGFAFMKADGSATTGNLTIGSGYTINGSGANSVGILARTNGSVSSGTNITMDAAAGAAIEATNAQSLTNSGTIGTSSNTGSTILAQNTAAFTNSGSISSTSTVNANSLIALNGTAASRAISNTGSIISASQNATVIDASGSANNTLTNSGTLRAASPTARVVLTGSGNDSVTLTGSSSTIGEITLGSGSDQFSWDRGEFSGGVTFSGGDGQDRATVGDVSLSSTTHILSQGGTGSTLTFNGTHAALAPGTANIGSFSADNLSKGTNIGTGWSTLTLNGDPTDVRVVDNLTLSGTPIVNVNSGATLRSADNSVTSGLASINNYNVATNGATSLLVFDGELAPQTYSGIISGSGQLERAAGSTTLLGNNTYTGSTIIDGDGILQLGNGGTTGGLSTVTNITDNGTLIVNRADNVALNGAINGSGSFHQDGAGVTRLGGSNGYKAQTQVNRGTLLINGDQTQATGDTTVASGAALGGKGTIGGNVSFAANTVLTPGDGGAGTLAINGSLSLNATTKSQFDLGQAFTPGGALNDLVNVAGDLLLDGVVNVSTTPGGLFLPGVYRLFNYTGTLTNNVLDIGTLPTGNTSIYSVQTAIPRQVNLILGFSPDDLISLQYWDGPDVSSNHGPTGIEGNGEINGGTGVWLARSVTDTNNWTNAGGVGNEPWAQGAFAIFQGTGGTVTLSDANGAVITSGMQFTSNGYTLVGGASSAYPDGTVPLSILRSANLVPSVNYAAEGETTADAYFAIRVGAGSDGADLTTTLAADLVQPTTATDILKLVKLDPGRLILSGNNAYTGGTEIYGGTLNVSRDENLGQAGTSVLINNNSTLQIGADFTTSRPIFLSSAGGGQLDLYGNTFTPAGTIGGNGQFTVLSSDAVNDSRLALNHANTYQGATTVTGTDGTSAVAVDANATGAFGLASSTVTVNHQAAVNFNGAAQAQSHSFALDNGTLSFNDTSSAASSVTTAANGAVVNLTSGASGGAGRFTLATGTTMNLLDRANGGSSTITSAGRVNFAGQAQAEGATLANNAGGVVNTAGINGSTAIGSLSGAGNVELGGATLNEGALGRNDAISGIISGSGGGLGKVGSGTLTLTGDNSYTGGTQVQQGVLLVNGNQQAADGAVSVSSGATLGGNGVLGGAVTVADSGRLAAGADLGSVGLLTLGGLTLGQNSQVDFQFGQSFAAGGSLNDLIVVNGDLNLNGKLNITRTPGGVFDVGLYRVFNYTGSLTDSTLDIGSAPDAADDMYVQTSIAHQVNLVNRTGVILRFWDGAGGDNNALKNNGEINGGDGVWQNSSGNDNWSTDVTSPDGRFNAPFSDGSFAIFGGDKGTVTVDNGLGEVRVSGMQFATDGYVINAGTITTNTADTVIRVGDGSSDGAKYTATINSTLAGTGSIDKTDAGLLILNGSNTYSGGTQVHGGTLQVSRDVNLGLADTGLTLDGGTLRYGAAFDTDRAVTLGAGGGTIDTQAQNVALLNAVSGSGSLTKVGTGTLTLTQDNQYTGGTTIGQGNLQLGTGGAQGSLLGDIVDNGVLQINRSGTLDLTGNISGSGQLWQQGSGVTVLSGSNGYKGFTLIENGTLLAGGTNKLSAASAHIVSQNGVLDTGGNSQNVASLVNQGTVNLRGGDVGSTLTVHGDYVGLNGVLKIAAQQHSPGVADRLIVDGGTASGKTRLDIDVSQLGEQTEGDGIAVVEALNGATTTAQTTKDAFTLGADRLEAGAFEYRLFAGNAAGAGEDWFLRAEYRPDAPIFPTIASTVRQADLAVLGTLHLRVGDEQPYDAGTSEDREPRFWARYIAQSNHQSFNDATGSQADARMNGMQIGFDLYNDSAWRAGIYTTILDTDSTIQGANSGGYGTAGYNSMLSVYLGGYATWTATNGFYVDNVLQYGNHNIDLKNAADRQTYSPDGNSYLASVETGKPFQLGDSSWSLEPQAQLIWQHSDFDSIIMNGDAKTRVSVDADDAVIGRLGLRLAADYDTGHGHVKPYVRVNLWQELSNGSDSASFENTVNNAGKSVLTADQRYSSTEVAVGATWAVSKDVQAYSEVGKSYQNGGGKTQIENDFSGSIGMKIRF